MTEEQIVERVAQAIADAQTGGIAGADVTPQDQEAARAVLALLGPALAEALARVAELEAALTFYGCECTPDVRCRPIERDRSSCGWVARAALRGPEA